MNLKQLLLACALCCAISASARSIYVKQSATGTNTGTAWLNAFPSLVNALASAQAGDTIRVAQGTYKPGATTTSTFIMKSGVVVLGGYATDTTNLTRDWRRYPTILSGEIGSASNPYDNIIHILESNGTNVASVWDGFFVERGFGSVYGAPVIIYNGSTCTLRNFLFRSNQCNSNTGSVAAITGSSPRFEQCIFTENGSFGMDYWGTILSTGGNPSFFNCVFARNYSRSRVSALSVTSGTATVVNCTFFGNVTENPATGTAPLAGTLLVGAGATMKLSNSILYENRTLSPGFDYTSDSMELAGDGIFLVENSITQNYRGGTNVLPAVSPRFRDTANLAGTDGLWGTSDDGLQLMAPCSPALNSGNNTSIVTIATDLAGNARRYNNGNVDMGAYEFQGLPGSALRTVYVNALATGSGDGSSWINAFGSLQKALQYCADTIKVAAGTYIPDVADPAVSFALENGRVLLGGYPATGNPGDAQRNSVLYPTILSGRISATVSARRVVTARLVDSSTLLWGFTIRDCASALNLASGDRSNKAGLFLIHGAAPTLRECRITGNSYGIYLDSNAAPRFFDCVIDSNYQSGAIVRYSKPYFKRTVFAENHTIINTSLLMYNGGAVYQHYSQTRFDSCAFTRNYANFYGGALWLTAGSMDASNSVFRDNSAREAGGSIFADGASTVLRDCKFRDSIRTTYGGSVNLGGGTLLAERCYFRDGNSSYGQVFFNNHAQANLLSCVFDRNTASSRGAALYAANYVELNLVNCLASNNYAGQGGFLFQVKSKTSLTNCTIINNAGNVGALVNSDSATLIVRNSLFWGNPGSTSLNGITDIYNDPAVVVQPSATSISYSVTQFYGTNGTNNNTVGIDPRLAEWTDADGPDNIFFTEDDGARLTPCSPLLQSGNNAFVTEPSDITGAPRIVAGTVDPGAYEVQGTTTALRAVFVNAAATGSNDGSSWQNAYTSLWRALNNSCADTVRIAAGIYRPALWSRDSSFVIRHGKLIYGGYPATGNPSDADRAPQVYRTILSGNIGNPSDSTDNAYHVVSIINADTAVLLDGLTIQEGLANGPDNGRATGAGIYSSGNRLSLINCTVRNNVATLGAGGIYSSGTRLRMYHCVIEGNKTAYSGGGLSLAGVPGDVSITINACAFINNSCSAGGAGGGIYNATGYGALSTGSLTCSNSIFVGNTAYQGGAVYNNTIYKTTLTQCVFLRNGASWGFGSGVFNNSNGSTDPGYPRISNSIFYQNYWYPSQEGNVGAELWEAGCGTSSCQRTQIRYNRMQGTTFSFNSTNTTAQPNFLNQNNPAGSDGIWFTSDDGLRLWACSALVDFGSATEAAGITRDLLENPRIVNTKPDLGAYEFTGAPQGSVQNLPVNDSLIANREYTTADGWTHYYRNCEYLLSIKKEGRDIGTVSTGLRVKVGTTGLYGSNQSSNLSGAAYLAPGSAPWLTMNHYWQVTPGSALSDTVLVRFPFGTKDYNDLTGSNPGLTAPTQIRFFSNKNSQSPLDPAIPASSFAMYTNAAAAGAQQWSWSQVDSLQFADYYAHLEGGGSGGAFLSGPLSDLRIQSASASPASVPVYSPLTVSFTERNAGAAAAGARQVFFYISADNVLTAGANGDTVIARQGITQPIAGGASVTLTHSFTLPCGLAPGNYSIFVVADATNAQPESDETNNVFRIPLTVTAGSALPPTPVINAAPSASVCRTVSPDVTLTASNINCSGCTLSWSNGQPTASIAVAASGTYTVTLSNGCGSSNATQVVAINAPPAVSFITLPATPCGNAPFSLSATGAQSYTWSGPGLTATTGAQVTAQQPATGANVTYTVTGVDANGCSATVSRNIFVQAPTTIDILQYGVQICEGGSTQLRTTASTTGLTLLWTPATGLSSTTSSNVTASPAITTTYTLSATDNSSGCVSRDSVTVSVLPAGNCSTPAPDLVITDVYRLNGALTVGGSFFGGFQVYNQGNAAAPASTVKIYLSADNVLTPGLNGDVQLGNTYSIIGLASGSLSGSQSYNLPTPCVPTGLYYLFIVADADNQVNESNENNNAVSGTPQSITGVQVLITPAAPTICAGGSVTLTATGASSYSWSPTTGLNNSGAATVVAAPSATTTYTVTGYMNPCSATNTVTVTVLPRVTPAVSVAFSGCPSANLLFTAAATNGGNSPSYAWFVNGAAAGSGNTLTLNNATTGTQVYTVMTSNASCVTQPSAQSSTITTSCVQTAVSNLDDVEKLWVSPNPASDKAVLHLAMRSLRKVSLRLLSAEGQTLHQMAPVALTGNAALPIPVGHLAAGTYLLQITVGGRQHTERIIVVH